MSLKLDGQSQGSSGSTPPQNLHSSLVQRLKPATWRGSGKGERLDQSMRRGVGRESSHSCEGLLHRLAPEHLERLPRLGGDPGDAEVGVNLTSPSLGRQRVGVRQWGVAHRIRPETPAPCRHRLDELINSRGFDQEVHVAGMRALPKSLCVQGGSLDHQASSPELLRDTGSQSTDQFMQKGGEPGELDLDDPADVIRIVSSDARVGELADERPLFYGKPLLGHAVIDQRAPECSHLPADGQRFARDDGRDGKLGVVISALRDLA